MKESLSWVREDSTEGISTAKSVKGKPSRGVLHEPVCTARTPGSTNTLDKCLAKREHCTEELEADSSFREMRGGMP